jgi:hypothetical protein
MESRAEKKGITSISKSDEEVEVRCRHVWE